ncbi:MAG: alpha/beta hydrolase [Actinobacteria bacterium]|nr:alpha/beta hydrolase [Actinomycetota bacterium]
MNEPRPVAVDHDGLRHVALDWGGTGEPLLLLHPNGLCAGFFDPLARRLTDLYRVVGIDLRGHGGSEPPPTRAGLQYVPMAGDVVAVLDALGIGEFSAVGESLGGGVGAVVDRLSPGRLRRLVLCEGIAFDSHAFPQGHVPGEGGSGNYMAELARARRAVWPDRHSVRDRYASRAPFDVVAPEALDAYLRWGFFDRADGQVELACAPETEASIFEVTSESGGAAVAFDHLAMMRGRVSVFHGDTSYLPKPWFQAQADAVGAQLHTIPGGHFFLQEDTARGEAIVRTALGR